ncbi:MAG: hypothetical protein ACI9MR_000650, partial [Myxococcota bacterium]
NDGRRPGQPGLDLKTDQVVLVSVSKLRFFVARHALAGD